jgi:hypothetical protein
MSKETTIQINDHLYRADRSGKSVSFPAQNGVDVAALPSDTSPTFSRTSPRYESAQMDTRPWNLSFTGSEARPPLSFVGRGDD